MKYNFKHFNKKGFSLLEIILVIAVAAGFIIGVFMLLSKTQAGQRAAREANYMTTISTGVKALYVGVPSYVGITTAAIVNARVFPEDMLPDSTSTAPLNSWKGLVTIDSSNEGPSGAPGSSFTITYPSVPGEDCVKIVSQIGPSYYIIRVNGTTVKDPVNLLNPGTLGTSCKAGGNSNTIVVVNY